VARRRGVEQVELEALYRARFHTFLRVAEAVCGDVDLARDAVQEAFANALRSRGAFRGDGSLEAWVWRMVVNAARQARKRRGDEILSPVVELGAASSLNGDRRLGGLLAALPERQREVVFLRYYADLDYAAIGHVLGIAPGTVGATLTAARESLKRSLEEVPH
jgi:RNA polymerase sigma factor (sigma-70 family)